MTPDGSHGKNVIPDVSHGKNRPMTPGSFFSNDAKVHDISSMKHVISFLVMKLGKIWA